MVELFLCCSLADRDVASTIAARLEHTAEVTVVIDPHAMESVASRWEGGLSSAAILLLLSPDAVPPRVIRTDWEAVLEHVTKNADPPIGSVLVRDCGYPRLLERKHFFRWRGGSRETLRAIAEWVMRLHRLPEHPSFVPARLPWFDGRRDELNLLWETLVDDAGTVIILHPDASGKTSLAQQFARQAGAHFRDVLWVACGDRSPASIQADLAEQLGTTTDGPFDEAWVHLAHVAGQHRILLVLDDVRPGVEIPADPLGRVSVLVTTRSNQVQPPPGARVISIDKHPEIPIEAPEDPVSAQLWRAMAVCSPYGFPLELAARITEIDDASLPAACDHLVQGRLVDPLDDVAGRLRLSAASIRAAGDSLEPQRRRHAELVLAEISRWRTNPDSAKQYLSEIVPAFRWAATADWPLAVKLARYAHRYLQSCGRLAEAAERLMALRDAAEERNDWEVSDECSSELSWLRPTVFRGMNRALVEGDQLSFDFAPSQ